MLRFAVHPNGRVVATAYAGKQPIVAVWDALSTQLIVALTQQERDGQICHTSNVISMDFNRSGKKVRVSLRKHMC